MRVNDNLKKYLGIKRKWIIVISLALIVIVALLLRSAHINILLNGHSLKEAPILADALQYIKYAYNLVMHNVYSQDLSSAIPKPDSFRSPGYPLLIALCMRLTDGMQFIPAVLYVQAILGSLTVLFTYLLAQGFVSKTFSIFAALLVGLSPHLIVMSGYILTESLSVFILVAALLSYQQAMVRESKILSTISGLIFGLGYLTNETLIILPFILALIAIMCVDKTRSNGKGCIRQVVVFMTAFCIFPSIWMARNRLVVPANTLKGYNRAVQSLSHGAYPGFTYKNDEFKYFPYREDPLQPKFGSNLSNFTEILWKRAKENPIRYASWYLLEKPYYFWSWNILQGQGDVFVYPLKTSIYHRSQVAFFKKWIMRNFHYVVLFFSLAGIPALFKKKFLNGDNALLRKKPLILYGTCIYFTVLFVFFAPWPRYSIILRPEIYICALWSLQVYYKGYLKYCAKFKGSRKSIQIFKSNQNTILE